MYGLTAQLVERRHVNPEVAGLSPALVNLSLFIQIYLKTNIIKTIIFQDLYQIPIKVAFG